MKIQFFQDVIDIIRHKPIAKRYKPTKEEKEMQNDNVNRPSHYTSGEIECIDAIKASMTPEEFRGFLKGNSMKYIWRYRQKGKPIEDLRKAEWYLKKLIEEVEGHE